MQLPPIMLPFVLQQKMTFGRNVKNQLKVIFQLVAYNLVEETSFVIIFLSLLVAVNIKKILRNRLVQNFNQDRLSLTYPFDHILLNAIYD